jgi:RHS repeat-associated protein
MTRYTYDPRTFRLQRQRTEGYSKNVAGDTMTYSYTSGTNKQDDGFKYDLAGNIVNIFTRVTDCGIQGSIPGKDALNREFGYDALYRLTFADGREADTQSGNSYLYDDAPAPGTPNANNVRAYERTYNYDKLGNMLSVVQAGLNGFTREYTYNTGKNTLQKIEDGSSTILESYTYDSCGNTLNSSLNRKYTWNHADQLICYKNQVGAGTPTVYAQYDYAGQDRVSKMVRTGSHYERTIYIDGIFEYVWYDDGTLYQKNYIHVMDDTSRIAEIRVGDVFPTDINDSITYILEDQIGSSVIRLSTVGTVIDEEEYYPFGDSSLRTFTYKRYRYVGKERDAESGLYYYGARYYAAWTCRFISVDPLAVDYPHLTPYNYAGNKPIGDYDIDGMQGSGEQTSGSSEGGGVNTGDATFDKTANAILNEAKIHGATVEILYGEDGKTPTGISITQNGETNTANYSKEGGFSRSNDDNSNNPTGGALKSVYNSELRTKYHNKIADNAKNNLELLKNTNSPEAQEAIVDKAIGERNYAKTEVRKKLTTDAAEVTKLLEQDSKYTPENIREMYGPGGEKGTNLEGPELNKKIVESSGRSNAALKAVTPIMRALGWAALGYGTYLSTVRIYEDPTPETIGEEVGGTIGGLVGSIEGASMALAVAGVIAGAFAFALGGWVVLGAALIGGIIGGYIGSEVGGGIGRWLGKGAIW